MSHFILTAVVSNTQEARHTAIAIRGMTTF